MGLGYHAEDGTHEPDGTITPNRVLEHRKNGGPDFLRFPNFEVGHLINLKHGYQAPTVLKERAAALLDELKEALPFITDADAMVVEMLVMEKVRYDALLGYWFQCLESEEGLESFPDKYMSPMNTHAKNIVDFCGQLGLNPNGRFGIMKNASVTHALAGDKIARLGARGRALGEGLAGA